MKTEKPHIVVRDVFVRRDFAERVFESGLLHCSYWAEIFEVKKKDGTADRAVLLDLEAHRRRVIVTIADVKEAIALVVKGFPDAGGEIRKQVLEGSPDGPRCDAVLQIAALGKVKYS